MAIATAPTPACVSALAPRSIASSAARAAATPGDHSSTTAGFPFNAASERVRPLTSCSEKSGAGNGSYIHVALGGNAVWVAADEVDADVERGASGSVFTSPDSTIRRRVFNGTSVRVCVVPDGHATVSFTIRALAPRPMRSSFECCERNPDPAVTTLVLVMRSVCTVTRAPIASRLLFVPTSLTASDAAVVSKSLRKTRSCGA